MARDTPSEELPSAHDDIDMDGVELEPAADPAGHLRGDQTTTRAEKRVIKRFAGAAVVDDRPTHAFDRLLGGMLPALFPPRVAERVVVGDFPDCCLGMVALPMAGLALAHRVPADLLLPVVITAAQGEMLLDPNDLRAQLEAATSQPGSEDVAVQRPEPHIGRVSGKQGVGFPPVGAIVVEHLALSEPATTEMAARSPARVVGDPVRRIGDHQMRLGSCQQGGDIGGAGAVAAANSVLAQQPDVAGPSDRLIGDCWDAVGICQAVRA